MKRIVKDYLLNITLIFLFAGVAIYLSLKDSFDEVVDSLLQANIGLIMLAVILVLLYYFLEGVILSTFGKLYKKNYPLIGGYKNALIGAFFNNVTPFASGGQFAQIYTFIKQGLKGADAASVLMMNFIVYQLTMTLFVATIILAKISSYMGRFEGLMGLVLIGFLVNLVVIISLLGASISTKFHHFISTVVLKFLHKIKIVKNYELTKCKFEQQLEHFKKEMIVLFSKKKLLIVVFIVNIIKLTILYSVPIICFYALGYHIPLSLLYDIIAVSSFIYMITAFIPIPGASGGAEGTYILAFSILLFGVIPDVSIAVKSTMLVWRFATYYIITIIGGIVFSFSSRGGAQNELLDAQEKRLLERKKRKHKQSA